MSFWLQRLKSHRYLSGTVIGCVIVIVHLVTVALIALPQLNGYENFFTPYTQWLSFQTTGISITYFLGMPILVSLSGAQIVNEDLNSGFFWQAIRVGKPWYYSFFTQLIAIISGAMTVMIPLILDWLILWFLLPSIQPNVFLNYGNSILPNLSFFYDMFYTHPFGLVVIYTLIAGIVGGGFALLTSTLAVYINNKFTTLSLGFIISMLLSIVSAIFGSNKYIQSPVFLAMEFSQKQVPPVIFAVVVTLIIFIILSVAHYLGVKKRYDA